MFVGQDANEVVQKSNKFVFIKNINTFPVIIGVENDYIDEKEKNLYKDRSFNFESMDLSKY